MDESGFESINIIPLVDVMLVLLRSYHIEVNPRNEMH